MGTKMLSARDAAANEIATEQRVIGKGVEPFSCIGCGSEVSFVAAFPERTRRKAPRGEGIFPSSAED